MSNPDESEPEKPGSPQDLIFDRELNEIYLLLDHISGRSEKTLHLLPKINDTLDLVDEVCKINWPPTGTRMELAKQAATLLKARDILNSAASPANGATIAFTILVVEAGKQRLKFSPDASPSQDASRAREPVEPVRSTDAPPLEPGGADTLGAAAEERSRPAAPIPAPRLSEAEPPNPAEAGRWRGKPPSRASLAALAYPGLVAAAQIYRTQMRWIIGGLLIWLLLTCVLSWNVAAGHAILSRIDTLAKSKADILAKIDAADAEEARSSHPPPSDHVIQVSSGSAPVRPYCDRHRWPSPVLPVSADTASPPPDLRTSPPGATQSPPRDATAPDQFDSVSALRICEPKDENTQAYRVAYSDLADWITVWGWVKWLPHRVCHGACLAKGRNEQPLSYNATDEQWASIMTETLANAVLPVFYGILGAGAAVVRELWRKMANSLLSPRDFTLALGQLSLGAVIGACIGLFVTPTGGQGGAGLTAAVTLSASALSFIAGFGVEGVFRALESLIGRVFNTTRQV